MKRLLKGVLPVLLLILFDQAIKIYIDQNYMGKEFELIGNLIGFHPYQNIKYSWLNSITNLGISYTVHVIWNVVALICALVIYDFIKKKYTLDTYAAILFTFLFAGVLCSLIDKTVWGGSLDFIWLKGFFIFDIKDVYVSVAEVMAVAAIVFNYRGLRNISNKELEQKFGEYIRERFMRGRNK